MRQPNPPAAPTREASDQAEVFAQSVALILGKSCAAAGALTELAQRRVAGEDAFIIHNDRTWWVGSRTPASAEEVAA